MTEEKQQEPKFTKHQLVTSRKYAMQRDIVSALLQDNQSYTSAEVDKIIAGFIGKKGRGKK